MSRHYFKTEYQGKSVTVLMGYDRPLGGFFYGDRRRWPG